MITIDGGFLGRAGGRSPNQNQVINSAPIGIEGTFTAPQDDFRPEFFVPEQPRSPISVNVFNPAREDIPLSDGTLTERNIDRQTEIMENRNKAQAAIAGARFFTDVMNAQSQYIAVSEKAKTNIFLAHQSAADAISQGKQAALQLESQGRQRGDSAKLAMAAQGQDVQGEGVERVVEGQEAVGVYNAMIAEINASRQALGFEQEAVQYESQIEMAELQRNYSIFSSALNFGASAAMLGA